MDFQPQDPPWNPNFQKPPNQSYLEALPIQISSLTSGANNLDYLRHLKIKIIIIYLTN